jgi:transposase
MAHLHKKVKKGRTYYYIREIQRVNGKPTVTSQVYLGSADRILSLLLDKDQALPDRFASKEFGSLFVLNEIDKAIDLTELVDTHFPAKRQRDSASLGQLLYYAVLNRAIAPRSKRQLTQWFQTTDIQQIRPVRLESLSSQHFWNQWDRLSQEQLDTLIEAFFAKLYPLLPPKGDHLLFDTTNYYTYLDSRTPSELAKRGYNKAGKHHLRQVGLALMTERSSGLPVAYWLYPGNQHDSRFFDTHLDQILEKLEAMGRPEQSVTLIFDKGMNSEGTLERVDAVPNLHFITSYSPYFAPQLARIPLKQFEVLPTAPNLALEEQDKSQDQLLYLETTATFWGQPRHVVVVYNPKTFRKKRYELRDKLHKVRTVLYDLRRKHRDGSPHWREPSSVRAHYERLCEELHLSPAFFDLNFYQENGQSQMAFHLNRYQTEVHLKRLAKLILISDHEDWNAVEIYQAYIDRYQIEHQFRQAKSPFHVALMPQYHWTDSKIRIHMFVCIVALTYLTLLRLRLEQAGVDLSVLAAMAAMRELRTALYWLPGTRKPRRQLEQPTPTQLEILTALGFDVEDGWVLQTQSP